MITSLFELYFRFRRFILVGTNKKSDFYELWQQHQHLKTMVTSEAIYINMYRDIYINPNLNWLTKFTRRSRSTEFKDIFLWIISQIYHENHTNQHQNSHKLSNETGHSVVHLKESHWKLRQQHDQNFPIIGKPL